MAEKTQWLLYGATGYTGRLIAEEAARRGMRPMLAARSGDKLLPLGERLSLPTRIFSLDDPARIVAEISDMRAVLNCAGPFAATAQPMIEACVAASCHYLDITGEIDVIEYAATQHAPAEAVGVTVMPAVGFDVVPSDCLARSLAEAMPAATQLTLVFKNSSGLSPGTTKTLVRSLPAGARRRRDGVIETLVGEPPRRSIMFRGGERAAVMIGWGDVSSAFYTTGIPNIETYIAFSPLEARSLRVLAWLAPWLASRHVERLVERAIDRFFPGPGPAEREQSRASFWGEVRDSDGRIVTATLDTPGGYQLTPLTALECLGEVLAGNALPGFATPAAAFGKDFILRIPGTKRLP